MTYHGPNPVLGERASGLDSTVAVETPSDQPQIRDFVDPDWQGPTATVRFHVRCRAAGPDFDEIEEWDKVFLSGGNIALGQWELGRAVPMETDDAHYPRWRSPPVQVPIGPVLEYKYVIMRSLRWEERKHIRWEDFVRDWGQERKEKKNRFLTTEGLPAVCEIIDTRFSELEMNEDASLRMLHQPINLYIVVHGERFQHAFPAKWRDSQTRDGISPYDDPLTRTGYEMARLTGERLEGQSIQYVYTSPHTRCVQTAATICNTWGDGAPTIRIEEGLLERVEHGFPSVRDSASRVLQGTFPEDVPCMEHPPCEIDVNYESCVPCAWKFDDYFSQIGYWQAREHHMEIGRPPFYDNIRRRRQLLAFKVMQRHQGGGHGRGKGKGRGRGRGVAGSDAARAPGVLLVGHRDVEKFMLEWLTPARWDWKLCRAGSVTKLSFRPGGWGLELEVDRDASHVAHLLGPIHMRPCKIDENAWKRWPRMREGEPLYGDDGDDGQGKTEYFTPSDQPGNQDWIKIVKY